MQRRKLAICCAGYSSSSRLLNLDTLKERERERERERGRLYVRTDIHIYIYIYIHFVYLFVIIVYLYTRFICITGDRQVILMGR